MVNLFDSIKGFFDYNSERIKKPFAGTFISIFLIHNWQLILLFLYNEDDLSIPERIQYIQSYISSLNFYGLLKNCDYQPFLGPCLDLFLFPAIASYLAIFVWGWLETIASVMNLWRKKKSDAQIRKADNSAFVDRLEVQKLEYLLSNKESEITKLKKDYANYFDTIKQLNETITNKNQEENGAFQELKSLQNNLKELEDKFASEKENFDKKSENTTRRLLEIRTKFEKDSRLIYFRNDNVLFIGSPSHPDNYHIESEGNGVDIIDNNNTLNNKWWRDIKSFNRKVFEKSEWITFINGFDAEQALNGGTYQFKNSFTLNIDPREDISKATLYIYFDDEGSIDINNTGPISIERKNMETNPTATIIDIMPFLKRRENAILFNVINSKSRQPNSDINNNVAFQHNPFGVIYSIELLLKKTN